MKRESSVDDTAKGRQCTIRDSFMLDARSHILVLGDDPRWRDVVRNSIEHFGADAAPTISTSDDYSDVPKHLDAAVVAIDAGGAETAASRVACICRRFPHARVVLMGCGNRRDRIRSGFRAGAWSCIDDAHDTAELIRTLCEPDAQTPTTDPAPLDASRKKTAPTAFEHPHEHTAFLHRLAEIRRECQHQDRRVTLGLFDLDGFHAYNERHSPTVGDSVLRWFERTLHEICRSSDFAFRDHGDEYVVILPDADEKTARELAEQCRQAMRSAPFEWDGRAQELTVSVGVVESSAGCIETEHQLLQRARIAVTQAKQFGGNATVSWTELLAAPLTRVRRQPLSVNDVSHWMARLREQVRSTQLESTQALVAAIDARDPYTRLHSLTVSLYADWIGRRMDLPLPMLDALRAASLLHDVGKIGVPDAILTKPGPLTEEEFAIVRRHPQIALDILAGVSFLNDERPLILHHHERFDGGGYPAGLAGDSIPIGARILAVADALDTMLTPRAYKKAYDTARVRNELFTARGRQFDPAVTDTALRILTEEPELFPDPAACDVARTDHQLQRS